MKFCIKLEGRRTLPEHEQQIFSVEKEAAGALEQHMAHLPSCPLLPSFLPACICQLLLRHSSFT